MMCGGTGPGELLYPLNMKRKDTSPPNAPRTENGPQASPARLSEKRCVRSIGGMTEEKPKYWEHFVHQKSRMD
jgi:hypothetical protein